MSKILLLLDNQKNSCLMAQWLETRYEVIVSDALNVATLWEQPFDLCILCGVTLERITSQVKARREAESPVLLPFLLVTSRRGVGMATRLRITPRDNYTRLWQNIDELIVTPIEKLELLTRVEVLLRSRQLSQQLSTANKKLLMEVEQRRCLEAEIRDCLQKEREMSELKSRFVAMVSHEFRSPLQIILSCAQIIELHAQQLSQDRKKQFFRQIKQAVKKMSELIDDVLLIGKVDLGKFKSNIQPLNLVELCSDIVEEIRLSTSSHQEITLITSGKCSKVYVDEHLIRHILCNLLTNAVKYSPSNSIINLFLHCHDDEAIFQIQDYGIGIPSEDKEKLFSLFHRATNVKDVPGTGLGLAIVKRCVDLYGGEIAVESELGVGTTFTVTLPLPQLAAIYR